MKRLYATTDPTEAEVLRALLRDAGIESTLDNEGGAAYAIGLPTGAVPLGINVRDEDAAPAAEILAAHFEKHPIGEDDPDAPPPLTPEESAAFEEKVRKGNPRIRRAIALFIVLFPSGAVALALASERHWEAAFLFGGAIVGLIAFFWFVDLINERKDPPLT